MSIKVDSKICGDCGSSNPYEMKFCHKCEHEFNNIVSNQTPSKPQHTMSRKNKFIINLLLFSLIIGLVPMTLLLIFALTFTGGLDASVMGFMVVYTAYLGFMIYLNKYKKSRDKKSSVLVAP